MEQQAPPPHQPEWSRLPRHILFEIARRLNNKTTATAASPLNTLRLRSVCKSWRSAIPAFKQQRETLHFPLDLPFPVTPNPNHDLRGCFSLSQNTVYFVQPPSKPSSLPWLLRVEEKDAEKGKWKALNPLSKVSTDSLPRWFPKSLDLLDLRVSVIGAAYALRFIDEESNKNKDDWTTRTIKALMEQSGGSSRGVVEAVDATLAEKFKSTLILRVAVSPSPWSGGDGDHDYAVAVIHGQGKLGFYKLGDEKWTPVSDESKYHDVVYHGGRFYAVDYQGGAVVIGSDLKAKQAAPPLPGSGRGPRDGQIKSLVESGDGQLYLVDKNQGLISKVQLRVYKLDETKKVWERVYRLNDQVFFVGDDCSYSVFARDFPALKGNCVYFPVKCYNVHGEEDACDGVQDLESGACGPVEVFQPDRMTMFTLPTWLKPKARASKK
ncbi:hypothetical protein RHSIM_Rhsim02G0106100 [Rhododendron simsii]|uniref:F-box domain-containing protein n=1 Tax=Rhododendron simsii TaxID=118357 RepID=A0A834LW22_RHOSS|nr:hypothetical protein RHSIM_Rhsim02G0106100 [Rhododendron simsii]